MGMINMAASMACEPDFGSWLIERLEKLSIDHEVFGSYITGILETEDISDEEKSEALYGVIGGVTEEEIVETTCKEILSKWHKSEQQATPVIDVNDTPSETTESRMASIMEKHATTVVKKEISNNQSTAAEKQRLLAQYGEISEDEEDDEATDANDAAGFKNRNADDVAQRQKEQREKDKNLHEQRKEQNRVQQEKQKQAVLDRKDKEKKRTQKQEKHR